jgi:hypothetical protein
VVLQPKVHFHASLKHDPAFDRLTPQVHHPDEVSACAQPLDLEPAIHIRNGTALQFGQPHLRKGEAQPIVVIDHPPTQDQVANHRLAESGRSGECQQCCKTGSEQRGHEHEGA